MSIKQFHTFWHERLMTAEVPLNEPIKKNSFLISGKFEYQKTEKKKTCLLEYFEQIEICCEVRKQWTLYLFETELFGVAQSFVETNTSLCHRNKSEILKKIPSFNEYTISNLSTAVINLSPFVKGIDVRHCNTFKKVFYHLKDHKRIDLIVDRYFKDSIKENLRD